MIFSTLALSSLVDFMRAEIVTPLAISAIPFILEDRVGVEVNVRGFGGGKFACEEEWTEDVSLGTDH
eukprot:g3418.t1